MAQRTVGSVVQLVALTGLVVAALVTSTGGFACPERVGAFEVIVYESTADGIEDTGVVDPQHGWLTSGTIQLPVRGVDVPVAYVHVHRDGVLFVQRGGGDG